VTLSEAALAAAPAEHRPPVGLPAALREERELFGLPLDEPTGSARAERRAGRWVAAGVALLLIAVAGVVLAQQGDEPSDEAGPEATVVAEGSEATTTTAAAGDDTQVAGATATAPEATGAATATAPAATTAATVPTSASPITAANGSPVSAQPVLGAATTTAPASTTPSAPATPTTRERRVLPPACVATSCDPPTTTPEAPPIFEIPGGGSGQGPRPSPPPPVITIPTTPATDPPHTSPTTAPTTSPTTAPTTTAPTTTTTTVPVPPVHTVSSPGGSIDVTLAGGRLTLEAVHPAEGYRDVVLTENPGSIAVRFIESPSDWWRINVRISNGEIDARVIDER
jgi:hypothetical protein